jgi:SAM-dependent methyltransferase
MNFKYEIKTILNYKSNNNIKNLSILDIGCGSGNFLLTMKKFNFDLTGIDIDAQVILNLKNNYQINAEVNTFSEFKTNKKFDVIYMSHFLEHCPNPMETLLKAKNLLKKGGMVIIKVPNIDSFSFRIFGKFSYFLDIPRHIFMFSPKTMQNYLDICDFEKTIITTKISGVLITSILNIFNLGNIRRNVSNKFIFRLIYFSLTTLVDLAFKVITLPFYFFFYGEELVVTTFKTN